MGFFSNLLKEKTDVPIVYRLGWWAHQEILEITLFEVQIVKSNLNLLNSVSTIRYTVKGHLHKSTAGMPYIQFVHHSEQLLKTKNEFSEEAGLNIPVHAHIQITPIVNIKNGKSIIEEQISFEFTNEYKVKSLRWGHNCFQFSCSGINKMIHLSQPK